MKAFAAGLLFVNLVFAIWYSVKSPEEVTLSRADPGVELLVMVNEPASSQQATDTISEDTGNEAGEPESDTPAPELPAETPAEAVTQARAESGSQDEPAPAPTQSRSRGDNCYMMSLFDSRENAQLALTELQQRGYQVRLATRYSSKVKYLVYLPAYASAQEAREITRELEEKGQTDFQILPIKGKRHSISLGIYSQPHTAEIRQKQIESLGYSPLVEPVFGTPMGFQLEFNKPDVSRIPSAEMRNLIKIFKNLTIRPQKCSS